MQLDNFNWTRIVGLAISVGVAGLSKTNGGRDNFHVILAN
jgi:hypothetical protein